MRVTYHPVLQWLISHARAARCAWQELTRTPVVNTMTILVLGIAISLPLGFFMLLKNFQHANVTWRTNTPSISLYLKTQEKQMGVNEFIDTLKKDARIEKVIYIPPTEGLQAFEKNTAFNPILKLFPYNPIPGVLVVYPTKENRNPTAMNTLYLALKKLPSVDVAQLDMEWITRLNDIIRLGDQLTKALAILFACSVLLIIAHTLRASLSHGAPEIQILKLLGASHAYIRRALLYRGMLYGLLGSMIAWMLIDLLLWFLESPVANFTKTYHTDFRLQLISITTTISLFAIATLLGFVSAWLITTQFLNRPEQAI